LRASGSQPPKDSAMFCPKCVSDRLTAIHIRLAPDEDHTFASCQACEWKGWFKQGGAVPLGKVLALASERRF
jgi:RNase P subunit RPR2